jgi:hypothetical protein
MCKAKRLLGKGSNLKVNFYWVFFWTIRRGKQQIKLTDQPGKLIPLDRGEVPDLSLSGDNFDLVGGDPHDLTTMSETRSASAIA